MTKKMKMITVLFIGSFLFTSVLATTHEAVAGGFNFQGLLSAPFFSEAPNIKISEVASKQDDNSGWIEIHNAGSSSFNLLGYELVTRDEDYTFEDEIVIPAGERLVVYAYNDKFIGTDKVMANFRLSKEGEEVSLLDENDQLIDKAYFGEVPDNYSRVRQEDQVVLTDKPTEAEENKADNATLVINEAMVSNYQTAVDPQGQYSNYVEIANNGLEPVDLNGYILKANDKTWPLPDKVLDPQEQFVCWLGAQEDYYDEYFEEYQAELKIEAYRTKLQIVNADGVVVDQLTVKKDRADVVYGHVVDGNGPVKALNQATPGSSNVVDDLGEI